MALNRPREMSAGQSLSGVKQTSSRPSDRSVRAQFDVRCNAAHTIVISRRRSGAKMDFGMSAWTPRTMSTTWVTRKLTAMLHSA